MIKETVDGWMKIEAVNKGLFGTKYIAYVKWADEKV